jgi:hypothetical protein
MTGYIFIFFFFHSQNCLLRNYYDIFTNILKSGITFFGLIMSGESASESEKKVQQEKLSLEHLSKEERDAIRSQTNVSSVSKVGYISLYRYASRLEVFGLVLCSISAVAAGAVLPLMTVCSSSL